MNPLSVVQNTTSFYLGHPENGILPYSLPYSDFKVGKDTYHWISPLTCAQLNKVLKGNVCYVPLDGAEKRKLRRCIEKANRKLNAKLDKYYASLSDPQEALTSEFCNQEMAETEISTLLRDVQTLKGGPEQVRNNALRYLNYCIGKIADEMRNDLFLRQLCFNNPDTDFIRTKKISLKDVLLFELTMAGGDFNKEVYDYFKINKQIPTVSGMDQRRAQLKPEGMKYFYSRITEICLTLTSEMDANTKHIFSSILAIDGSDINIAYDPKSETCFPNKDGKKGWNQVHLNGLLDIGMKTFVSADLQPSPKMHEVRAITEMIRKMMFYKRTLLTADRGYGSLNLIYTVIIKKNLDCMIRVKEDWIKELKNLGLKEFDEEIELTIITTQRKEDKIRVKNGLAKYLSGKSVYGKDKVSQTWDYDSETVMKFRAVRFKLPSGNWETLVTTLSKEEFPLDKLIELYHIRWNIENQYRHLKYDNHLAQMHCKGDDLSEQEIYARLAMNNIVSCVMKIASKTEADNQGRERINENGCGYYDGWIVGHGKKHDLVLNRRVATHVICDYFQHPDAIHYDVIDEIIRHKTPIRPGRSYKRDLKNSGFVDFVGR